MPQYAKATTTLRFNSDSESQKNQEKRIIIPPKKVVAKFPFLEIKCFCCNVNIDHGLHPFDKMDVIGGTFTTIEVLFRILER